MCLGLSFANSSAKTKRKRAQTSLLSRVAGQGIKLSEQIRTGKGHPLISMRLCIESIRLEMRRAPLKLTDGIWIAPATLAVEMPIGLSHIDSDFCWCEPVVEVHENGEEVLVHRQVTWN
jgi:hypothetical protein